MQDQAKKTPLFEDHIKRKAKMGDFGGYSMPLWYPTGAKNEHLAVIQKAGIFDTSHMAGLTVTGKDAFGLLQTCFSKDLSACIGPNKKPIEPGKSVYGLFLNDRGGVIDDTLVYCMAEDVYFIIVNAGMGGIICDHLSDYKNDKAVEITDLTDKLGKIDVQGPNALKIVESIIQNPETIFEKLPYFNFKGGLDDAIKFQDVFLKDGTPILLSRTGYTGEFGFELFTRAENTQNLWDTILKAGENFGALTCGLAARDSLRAGAVLPLPGAA